MSFSNPEPEAIRTLLKGVKTIAIVGFSPKPGRPSHNIALISQRWASALNARKAQALTE